MQVSAIIRLHTSLPHFASRVKDIKPSDADGGVGGVWYILLV